VSLATFRMEFRRSRTMLLWLGLLTAAYAGFITVFYTNVVENAAAFRDIIKLYPKEIMAAFDISGDLDDPGVFLGGYVFSFLWPLVAAIAAVVVGTRIASDAERGYLDIGLTTPVTRIRYLMGSIATQFLAICVLAVAMVGAIFVGDALIEPNFPPGPVAASALHSVAFGVAIAGPTTLLAVALLDRGRAAGIAAGILVLMYLVKLVGALSPDLDGLAVVSIFRYFDLKPLIGEGAYPAADSALLSAVGLIGWGAALIVFRRRDLTA
jgi:ABC-2 type transport system permease protein